MAGVLARQTQSRAKDPVRSVEEELRGSIRGEVRFDRGSRALYSMDGSNYRQVPLGVVIPRDTDDAVRAVQICHRHQVPILPRGGGTSLAGQCCNVAVVLDFSKYLNAVLDIDPENRTARVQPGLILDSLKKEAALHGLTFGPDPATHNHCTLGGMIGNNSCGIHSVLAERIGPGPMTRDNVKELEILTYDGIRQKVGPTSELELESIIRAGGRRGEIYSGLRRIRDRYGTLIRSRFPRIPRRASGYNLEQLLPENGFNVARALVGTEGTCVTVLSADLHLIPAPKESVLLVLAYPDIFSAAEDIPLIREFEVSGIEGMDSKLLELIQARHLHAENLKLLPEGQGWLLVEFGGDTEEEASGAARALMDRIQKRGGAPAMRLVRRDEKEEKIWRLRESGLGATARVPGKPDTWPGWEDSSVPPEKVGEYLRSLKDLFLKYDYEVSLYGHFGQGCIHCRVPFDLKSEEGRSKYRGFLYEATDLVLSLGGSLSGEHGDGQARGELLEKMYGSELIEAFREFKSLWDPDWRMNPGKVIDPRSATADLKLAEREERAPVQTRFKYKEDGGDFERVTLRCVGVGECRRLDGGTMCPSFMVTREEKHSTRGRAHLLYEMLRGDPIRDLWQSEEVKESLDLCLACKGCKSDCPMSVDMATYKAEFFSHYYEKRRRPITAYTMGWIQNWAPLASLIPSLANFATQTPVLRWVAKKLAGVTTKRAIPAFARQNFKSWFSEREPKNPDSAPVLLWADTFTNYFHPEIGRSAVEVLESAGFRVIVPGESLCCGRPLYDYGMLAAARRYLQQILTTLHAPIHSGIPVVGLEPSCTSVFRDELVNLFPEDETARLLSNQTFTLAEFLAQQAPNWKIPGGLKREALVHGHCHHKSVMGMGASDQLFHDLGLEFKPLDSGCCGMAGSFGFEPDKYDISVQVGERALLPAVRQAAQECIIISDGFSCRTQIEQLTSRRALHTAQVLSLALQPEKQLALYPERAFRQPIASPLKGAALLLAFGTGLYFAWKTARPRMRQESEAT